MVGKYQMSDGKLVKYSKYGYNILLITYSLIKYVLEGCTLIHKVNITKIS